jgi:adenylate kinase
MISGPPGSGKGGQVELLVRKLGVQHVTTAGLVQQAIRSGSFAGKLAAQAREEKTEIADEVLCDIIQEQLSGDAAPPNGWVLDGFPRNAAQVALLSGTAVTPDRILLVDVAEASAV